MSDETTKRVRSQLAFRGGYVVWLQDELEREWKT